MHGNFIFSCMVISYFHAWKFHGMIFSCVKLFLLVNLYPYSSVRGHVCVWVWYRCSLLCFLNSVYTIDYSTYGYLMEKGNYQFEICYKYYVMNAWIEMHIKHTSIQLSIAISIAKTYQLSHWWCCIIKAYQS